MVNRCFHQFAWQRLDHDRTHLVASKDLNGSQGRVVCGRTINRVFSVDCREIEESPEMRLGVNLFWVASCDLTLLARL